MDFNKDISKIVYPIFGIIALAFYGYQYYGNYQIKKFVKIYNEQGEYISEVFKGFGEKAFANAYGDISKIKISDDEFNNSKILTNDMIDDGCQLLRSTEDECIKVNKKLLNILDLMYNNNDTNELNDKLLEYNSDVSLYQIFLKNEGVEYK